MPIILKVTKEEVVWKLGGSNINAGSQANQRIIDYLNQDAKYFASMSATSKGYSWSSQEVGWIPMGSESTSEHQLQKINVELDELRKRVRQSLHSNALLADEILSLPSDIGKYIFYKDDEDGFKILIAGWGFENSRRKIIIPGGGKVDINNNKPSKIGFTIDGDLQPFHKFYILTHGGAKKEFATGPDGFCDLGNQKDGTVISLIDADSDKTFTVIIEEGKSEYILDVTRNSTIRVKVSCDDKPVSDEDVKISYRGKTNELKTDADGVVKFSVPFFADQIINAKVKDVEVSQLCQYPVTDILIQLQSEKPLDPPFPPEPKFCRVSVRCVNEDGGVQAEYPIKVIIGQNSWDFLTGNDGFVNLPPQTVGTEILIKDGLNDSNSLSYTVIEGDNDIRFVVHSEVKPSVQDISLQMIGADGLPFANKQLVVRQDDKSLILNLDDNGVAKFKSDEFDCGKELTAKILSKENSYDRIPFTLEEGETEYVIQEEIVAKKPWWKTLLNIILGLILLLAIIWLGAFFVNRLALGLL